MAGRFRGSETFKVDSKGRVSIPATFRRVLQQSDPNWSEGKGAELVIVYGGPNQKYLQCYSVEAIEEVDAKIDALPRGSKSRKVLQKLYHGLSHPTSVDETGRLVLPAKLRAKLDITKDAFFIGNGDTFFIWNPETYEEEEGSEADDILDELPDDFDPVRLLDEPFPEADGGGS